MVWRINQKGAPIFEAADDLCKKGVRVENAIVISIYEALGRAIMWILRGTNRFESLKFLAIAQRILPMAADRMDDGDPTLMGFA